MNLETTTETLQAALAAADRGWRVFPVVPGRDKSGKVSWKKPVVRAWQLVSTTDPDTIRAWWGRFKNIRGYGWHTQGFVAIDFDIEGGEQLLNDNGLDTPPTIVVHSGNVQKAGHYTLVYRLPAGRRLKTMALANFKPLKDRQKFVGIDIRSSGGQIVGPGSRHATGGVYTSNGVEPAPAPSWLLLLSEYERDQYARVWTAAEAAFERKKKRGPSDERDGPIPPLDSDEELIDYLIAKYPVDAPGIRNQRQLLAVAWLLLVKKLPTDRVLRLIISWLTHYQGSYSTPLGAAVREASDMVQRTVEKMAGGELIPSPDHQRLAAGERENDESINRFMLSCSSLFSPRSVEAQFVEAILLHSHYHRDEVDGGGTLPLTDRQLLKLIEYRHGRKLSWNLFYRLKKDFVAQQKEEGTWQVATKVELLREVEKGTHGVPSRYAVSAGILRELTRDPILVEESNSDDAIARDPEE